MAQCPNCGTYLGCSCQLMTLPNGKQGCSKCYGTSATQQVNQQLQSQYSSQTLTPSQIANNAAKHN